MNQITEQQIEKIIKKHVGFTLFLAVAPIIFLLLIGLFEPEIYRTTPFILPLTILAAVIYFIKNVLIDLHVNKES